MNRVCSIFVQILQLISRAGSEAAVRRHRAERTPAASAVGDSRGHAVLPTGGGQVASARFRAGWRRIPHVGTRSCGEAFPVLRASSREPPLVCESWSVIESRFPPSVLPGSVVSHKYYIGILEGPRYAAVCPADAPSLPSK